MNRRNAAVFKFTVSMVIFGSIGLFVKHIPLDSSLIAWVRGVIGALFLSAVVLSKKMPLSASAIKQNLLVLCLSGACLGFNWILLFESYRYTSVAVSTLCYYMAPIITILLSPLVLKEPLSLRKLLCIAAAVCGMACLSGILNAEALKLADLKGILLGFGAAGLYAAIMLLNKKLHGISAYERTVFQLAVSAVVLLPYILLTCDIGDISFTPVSLGLLIFVGIVHTGVAYYLYFGSMEHLSGQSIAIGSYLDPVIAVIVSITLLREPFGAMEILGAALILGAAVVSELPAARGESTV